MARSGRDDLCPCGSGKKYESCCGDHKNPHLSSHAPGGTMERQLRSIERLIETQEMESIEDLNAFLRDAVARGDAMPGPATPAEEAQELIYQAWESTNRRQRVRLAKQALGLYPDCADAYIILAEQSVDTMSALEQYRKAVEAGERSLGTEGFQEAVGRFWGVLETRPYMRARLGLAQCLWTMGAQGAAVAQLQEMLQLNPMDNQGVRHLLLSYLLELNDLDGMQTLLEEYEDEVSAAWLFNKALVSFLREGDTMEGRGLLSEAMEDNPHVADYLLGRKRLPRVQPSYMGLGDDNEAIYYVSEFGSSWQNNPRARAWLESVREPEGDVGIEFAEQGNSNGDAGDHLPDNAPGIIPALGQGLEVEAGEHVPPSMDEWGRLYRAAAAFKKAEPWRWMDDEDLFAVANEDDGQMAYCLMLGSGGREFGLALFVGEEGYESYRRLTAGEVDPESFEAVALLRSLSLTFVSRDDLDQEDYEVIRALGLRFRGKAAWPLFRSQRPGWLPWFLDQDEARTLSIALEQSLEVLGLVREQEDALINYENQDLVLTRYWKQGRWHEEWRKPGSSPKHDAPIESFDLPRIEELRREAGKPSGNWEVDVFPVPGAMPARLGRLYYPHLSLAVDRSSGMVIDLHMTGPAVDGPSRQEAILSLFEGIGKLPRQVRVSSEAMKVAMEPLATALGLSLRVGVIPSLEEAKAGLVDMMISGEDLL